MDQEKKRDGFTFYWSFYESVSGFPEEDQKSFFKYIIEYALLGKNPEIDNNYLKGYFSLIKPNVDSSIKKYDQRKTARKGKTKKKRNGNETKTKSNNYNNNSIETDIEDDISNDVSNNKEELYSHYPSDFIEAMEGYEEMREKINAPLTDRARETILKKLHNISEGDINVMIEIINNSILNCWKDVYPLERNTKSKKGIDILDL